MRSPRVGRPSGIIPSAGFRPEATEGRGLFRNRLVSASLFIVRYGPKERTQRNPLTLKPLVGWLW